MSFFSSIWDAVTAPLTFAEQLASDVVSGKNVFQSVQQTAEKSFISATGGLTAPIISETGLKPVLEKASPLTLGVTGRLVSNADLANSVNNGGDVSFSQFRDYSKNSAENAAIVGGGIAVSAGLGAGAAAGFNNLDKGNIAGGIAAFAGGASPYLSDVGAGASEAYNAYADAQDYYNQAKGFLDQFKSSIPPQVSGYSSNTPGGAFNALAGSSGGLLLVAGAALAGYFLLKGKR